MNATTTTTTTKPTEIVVKHAPEREDGSIRKQDIYVSRRSHRKAIERRADTLLKEEGEVIIHALGAAILEAIEIALKVRDGFKGKWKVEMETSTSSVEIIDEILPTDEQQLPTTSKRINSAIHIKMKTTSTLI